MKTPKIGGRNMLNPWNLMKNAGKGTEVQSYSPGFPKPLWRPPHPPLSVFVEEIWRGHLMENPGCFFICLYCEVGSSVNFFPFEKHHHGQTESSSARFDKVKSSAKVRSQNTTRINQGLMLQSWQSWRLNATHQLVCGAIWGHKSHLCHIGGLSHNHGTGWNRTNSCCLVVAIAEVFVASNIAISCPMPAPTEWIPKGRSYLDVHLSIWWIPLSTN